jgi:putative flippase GtrA
MIKTLKARYLIGGLWNMVFGYGFGLGLFYTLNSHMHITLISLISNILSISMSFLTYKLFVFKVQGNWLREYLRCYILYGTMSVVSIALLWILVDFFKIPFWVAQGLVTPGMILFSYLGHKKFTFNK